MSAREPKPERDGPEEERRSFLLRLPPALLDDLRRWAQDELRSLNGHLEYVLRDAVRRHRREGAPK